MRKEHKHREMRKPAETQEFEITMKFSSPPSNRMTRTRVKKLLEDIFADHYMARDVGTFVVEVVEEL